MGKLDETRVPLSSAKSQRHAQNTSDLACSSFRADAATKIIVRASMCELWQKGTYFDLAIDAAGYANRSVAERGVPPVNFRGLPKISTKIPIFPYATESLSKPTCTTDYIERALLYIIRRAGWLPLEKQIVLLKYLTLLS